MKSRASPPAIKRPNGQGRAPAATAASADPHLLPRQHPLPAPGGESELPRAWLAICTRLCLSSVCDALDVESIGCSVAAWLASAAALINATGVIVNNTGTASTGQGAIAESGGVINLHCGPLMPTRSRVVGMPHGGLCSAFVARLQVRSKAVTSLPNWLGKHDRDPGGSCGACLRIRVRCLR